MMVALSKVRAQYKSLTKQERLEQRGQFGVYFTAKELAELLNDSALRRERARVRRLRKYIDSLEQDLSYAGTPVGFSSKEWFGERDKKRERLVKRGDLK